MSSVLSNSVSPFGKKIQQSVTPKKPDMDALEKRNKFLEYQVM